MIEHIARRGLQHAHGVLTRSDNSTAPISAFGYTLISTTAFLFMFLTFAVCLPGPCLLQPHENTTADNNHRLFTPLHISCPLLP